VIEARGSVPQGHPGRRTPGVERGGAAGRRCRRQGRTGRRAVSDWRGASDAAPFRSAPQAPDKASTVESVPAPASLRRDAVAQTTLVRDMHRPVARGRSGTGSPIG